MYLLKAVVLPTLALPGSLHLSLLSRTSWDQFRLSHKMSFDPNNSWNRAKSGLECFNAVVSQLCKYSVCPVKLQNGKCLILSAAYENQWSHLWNNHCKDLRIYYTNRKHTAKASWSTIDSRDKTVNELTWPQTVRRFLWARQNGCRINNRTTIRRGPEMTFSVQENRENMTSMWFGCNSFKS